MPNHTIQAYTAIMILKGLLGFIGSTIKAPEGMNQDAAFGDFMAAAAASMNLPEGLLYLTIEGLIHHMPTREDVEAARFMTADPLVGAGSGTIN